jgi:glycosyltransferase involved in cell wall biosynthesis
MAYGRPVVATSVGGLVDAVEDGVTGILVPPRDPDALREALIALLADPGLRVSFGRSARRGIDERGSRLRFSASMSDVYREASDRPA